MVICSGMLLSLNRTLASSTGCTVKHWMSAGVKEPQAPRGWGCRGEGMGGVREVLRDPCGDEGPGSRPPCPCPRCQDTLPRGASDVGAGRRCGLQLLSVGEGAQQPHLKVLPALVLLAPVNEDFVLWEEGQSVPARCEWGRGPSCARAAVSADVHGRVQVPARLSLQPRGKPLLGKKIP